MLFSSCCIKQTLTIRLNDTASNISSLFILLCSSWKLALVLSLYLHAFNYLYASQIFSLFLLWPRIIRAHLTHLLLFINLCLCFSLIGSFASVPQALLCKSLLSCRQSCTGPSRRLCHSAQPSSSGISHICLLSWREPQTCRSPRVHHRSTSASQPCCALLATLFCLYLKVSSGIWTLLLIFTPAKDFYSRLPTGKHVLLEQGNKPQLSLAVPDLATKHRHKPTVQTTFPVSVCTSLGQSKVPEELWGSLEVDKLNMCCDLARAQTLMDTVWLHLLHNGPAPQLAAENYGFLQRQSKTDHTPTRNTHLNLGMLVQLWAPLICVVDTLHFTEVRIYNKLLHIFQIPLCSGANILLDYLTAVSDLN